MVRQAMTAGQAAHKGLAGYQDLTQFGRDAAGVDEPSVEPVMHELDELLA